MNKLSLSCQVLYPPQFNTVVNKYTCMCIYVFFFSHSRKHNITLCTPIVVFIYSFIQFNCSSNNLILTLIVYSRVWCHTCENSISLPGGPSSSVPPTQNSNNELDHARIESFKHRFLVNHGTDQLG